MKKKGLKEMSIILNINKSKMSKYYCEFCDYSAKGNSSFENHKNSKNHGINFALAIKDQQIEEFERKLEMKDRQIEEHERKLEMKDRQIEEHERKLEIKEREVEELNKKLSEKVAKETIKEIEEVKEENSDEEITLENLFEKIAKEFFDQCEHIGSSKKFPANFSQKISAFRKISDQLCSYYEILKSSTVESFPTENSIDENSDEEYVEGNSDDEECMIPEKLNKKSRDEKNSFSI